MNAFSTALNQPLNPNLSAKPRLMDSERFGHTGVVAITDLKKADVGRLKEEKPQQRIQKEMKIMAFCAECHLFQ